MQPEIKGCKAEAFKKLSCIRRRGKNMLNIEFNLLSPIHIQDKTSFFIPPIIYSKRIYVINEKLLLELLTKIGLFKDFNNYIRERGYGSALKWFSSKDLLNEGFLENVSQYWIENTELRKLTDYRPFKKDLNDKPEISVNFLKNSFKKAFLYKYIKERKDEFNNFVNSELDFIERELSSIQDISTNIARHNNYKKHIFKHLLENFFVCADTELKENFHHIENICITNKTSLDIEDLSVYRVGNLSSYKNLKFQVINIAQQECISENKQIASSIFFNNFESDKYTKIQYLYFLFYLAETFAQDKIHFDKNYITQLITESDNDLNTIVALKNLNNYTRNIIEENTSKTNNNVAVLEDYREILLCKNQILNYYNSINDSNILFCKDEYLYKLISILNMEESSLARLNEVIYDKANKVESDIIKVSLEKGNVPYSPIGFAKINQVY